MSGPDPEQPAPQFLPAEEEDPDGTLLDAHRVARRRPDGAKIDDVGNPVPVETHPHHGVTGG
jgi:hypothetical protein